MAIALEFIDFVVPIALIREKYPGGFEKCLEDHGSLIGGRVWFDEHLLRDGAMNPRSIELLLKEWEGLGFQPTLMIDGNLVWNECCVIESLLGGPTLPCDWLELSSDGRSAWLKGTIPGSIKGRIGMAGGLTDILQISGGR